MDIKAHLAAMTEHQLASSHGNGVDTTQLESSLSGLNLDVSMHSHEARLQRQRQLEAVERDARQAAVLDLEAAEVAAQSGRLEEAASDSLLMRLAELAGEPEQAPAAGACRPAAAAAAPATAAGQLRAASSGPAGGPVQQQVREPAQTGGQQPAGGAAQQQSRLAAALANFPASQLNQLRGTNSSLADMHERLVAAIPMGGDVAAQAAAAAAALIAVTQSQVALVYTQVQMVAQLHLQQVMAVQGSAGPALLPAGVSLDAGGTGVFAPLFPPAAAAAATAGEEPVGARAGVVDAPGVGAARLAGKVPASLKHIDSVVEVRDGDARGSTLSQPHVWCRHATPHAMLATVGAIVFRS